ncbi:MAG: IS1634 family transposase, partial [Limibaculum sp.]
MRKAGGKSYRSFSLAESHRTAQGPRQRTLLTLGPDFDVPRADWRDLVRLIEDRLYGTAGFLPEEPRLVKWAEKIAGAVKRKEAAQGPVPGETLEISLETVQAEAPRELGPVAVGHHFWRQLEFDEMLRGCGLSPRYRRLAEVMVLGRLTAPASEHATPAWVRRTALDELMGADFSRLSEDPLYRVSDALLGHKQRLESRLHERERSLFGIGDTVFLYDLTSTYFEGGAAANPKAARGYSRDKRGDCKQVCVGLVLTAEGFVKAHEVFAGNRADTSTVEEMLEALRRRVGSLAGGTVVVDRGMAAKANLAAIIARGCHYVVAARQSERLQWEQDFIEGDWREVRPESPAGSGKASVRFQVREAGGEVHLLCKSEGRQAKDRAIRELAAKRLEEALTRLVASVAGGRLKNREAIQRRIGRIWERYPRAARFYEVQWEAERLVWRRLEEKEEGASQLDGTYLLRTSRKDMDGQEIWKLYTTLTRVEKAFQYLKSDLGLRPVF